MRISYKICDIRSIHTPPPRMGEIPPFKVDPPCTAIYVPCRSSVVPWGYRPLTILQDPLPYGGLH